MVRLPCTVHSLNWGPLSRFCHKGIILPGWPGDVTAAAAWDNRGMPSPMSRDDAQQAVDDANAAIRGFLRELPSRSPRTQEERGRYSQLVNAYMAAVRGRDGARENDDEPAPAAA